MPRHAWSSVLSATVAIIVLLGLAGCRTSAASSAASVSSAPPASKLASSSPSATSVPVMAASTTAPSGPPEVVKLADAQALPSAPLYVAIEKGYFREQGIDAQLEHVAGGADVVPFLATGDLDLNLGAISVGLFNAFERGADIHVIAPAGIQPLHDASLPLVVRKDLADNGEIRQAADLRGRKVAINTRGASVEYVLSKIMERAGYSVNDVDMVPVPFPDMPTALANGSVDAAIPAEPFATRSVDLGVGTKLIKEVIPGQMTTMILASGKFLKERPDIARRFMLAYMNATRDIQPPQLGVSDPAKLFTSENLKILEQYTGAPEKVLRNQVPYTWDVDLEIQVDSLMDQQLTHMRNGLLQLDQPIPAEKMVDSSFVEYARQVMGRLRQ